MSFENDPAVQELMQKMASAVKGEGEQREHLKTASAEDLDNPGDILTRTIHGINDQVRAESFPEEHAKIAADRDARLTKAAADKSAKKTVDDDGTVTGFEHDVREEGVSFEIKEAMERGENPFYNFRKIAEELVDPKVAQGFSDYLEATEPLWKQSSHKLMLYGMNAGAREANAAAAA